MTALRCDACGRELAGDTPFCPYCGADRRKTLPPGTGAIGPAEAAPAPAPAPAPAAPAPASVAATPADLASAAAPPTRPDAVSPSASAPPSPPPVRTRRSGCTTPLLVLLLAVLAGVSWCALHRAPTAGAPAVAGATAARPLHVSRRWRTVNLPGDAAGSARFAISSDTALRLRAAGRAYAVRPRHPLQLPDDVGESFDVRTADYVSAQDAARAKAALITLRGG